MVMRYLLLILMIPLTVWSQDVQVTAEIEQGEGVVGRPLTGTVSITHDKNLKVDTVSFKFEGKPLSVEPIREVRVSPDAPLVISMYRFEIPGKPIGRYLLSEISVKVGGKEYQSLPTPFEVEDYSPDVFLKTPSGQEPVLELQSSVEGKSPLYPGQRLRLVYHFRYNTDIELREERLPFLEPDGFLKIGSAHIEDYTEGDFNVQKISVEVEAVKPGEFHFDPSKISGYAYVEDLMGNRIYGTEELHAVSPAITVTVLPLPEPQKPLSFNGAVGSFTIAADLLTPSHVNVGDAMRLAFTISGEGDLEEITLPSLICQPGISGFFQMSDLPPIGKVTNGEKRFIVEMRPQTSLIDAIPSLEFSYFSPEKGTYVSLRTDPIAIQVSPVLVAAETVATSTGEPKIIALSTPMPVNLPNLKLSRSDLSPPLFASWWVILLVPFGIGILLVQLYSKQHLKQHKFRKIPLEGRFQKAIQNRSLWALEKVFSEIEAQTPTLEVKLLLAEIQERRFSGNGESVDEAFLERSRNLFFQLRPPKQVSQKNPSAPVFPFWWASLITALILLAGIVYYIQIGGLLKEGDESYSRGLTAKTFGERGQAFNAALSYYLELSPRTSGKLEYNIANTFFQLEQYPLALLHYYRAYHLMPRDTRVWTQIAETQKKLGISQISDPGVFRKLFFFQHLLSFPERLQIFSAVTLLAFLFGSCYIWFPISWMKRWFWLAGMVSATLLISLFYSWYFEPIEGVMLQPSTLNRDAGLEYARVLDTPIPSGTKVEVVEIREGGRWLKVVAPDGVLGYVPYNSIRMITTRGITNFK